MSDELDAIIYDLVAPKRSEYPGFNYEDLRIVADAAYELGRSEIDPHDLLDRKEARGNVLREHRREVRSEMAREVLASLEELRWQSLHPHARIRGLVWHLKKVEEGYDLENPREDE